MEYMMNESIESREYPMDASMSDTMSSQENAMHYTMDENHRQEDTMDYPMSHEAINLALSQLADASEYSEDEDELPILDFARLIGIARNHQLDDTSIDNLLSMKDGLNHNFSSELHHDHLPQLNVKANFTLDERPFVHKDVARLLASVAQNESQESIDALIYSLLGSKDVTKMRVELPLLSSDHESDFLRFARRDGFELKPQDIKLPLELVNIENNEGLRFPPEFYSFETEVFETIMNERIEVTRNTMIYLQTALKATLSRDDEQDIWASARTNLKKFPISNHVTPPLSPMLAPLPESPPPLPSSGCEIPLLSDPESLTSLDLKKIEDEIFKEDFPTPMRDRYTAQATPSASDDQCLKPGDIYSPPEYIKNFNPLSSPLEKKRAVMADLKVEELLTPPRPSEESGPKTVHFSSIVEELLLSHRPQSGISETVLETRFFEEAFGESGEQANHRVEQERLVDTRNQVEVPAMDFTIPGPPWMVNNFRSVNVASSSLQKNIEDVGIDRSERWPGLKSLHIKLPWAPFKHDLGSVDDESMGDDKSWESFVQGPCDGKVITSSDLTWKMEGLRILRQDEDDEDEEDELEMGSFSKEVDDISSLVRKRKSEMEDAARQVIRPLITPEIRHDLSKHQDNCKTTAKRSQQDNEQNLLLGGIFSAKDALSNFLEIRGVKNAKLIESAHFPAPKAPPLIPPNQEHHAQESPTPANYSLLPTPTIAAPETPIFIILSSVIIKNRPLIRSLQSLIPTLKICERDFSAHNTTIWNPGSVVRSPVTSTLTHEADIIISPTTGLILTTLQHIKQKPLPGHKTAVPIRGRLEKVSGRYENLIILVSSPPNGLGDSDCTAWADFVGFTLTLKASIIVNYIPVDSSNPSDQTMAKYISALIVQHNPPPPTPSQSNPLELLEQESYWEIWLRRAGMNAYAAQATIVQLKEPEPRLQPGDEGYEAEIQMINERGPYGLSLFVRMGAQERMRTLGELVGRGVLERVGWTVDQVWE